MRLAVYRGVATPIPTIIVEGIDKRDPEVLRNKLLRVFQYAIRLSQRNLSSMDHVELNGRIKENLEAIISGSGRNVGRWLEHRAYSLRDTREVEVRRMTGYFTVFINGVARFRFRNIRYELSMKSINEMLDEATRYEHIVVNVVKPKPRRAVRPVVRAMPRPIDDDDYFNPLGFDDIYSSTEEMSDSEGDDGDDVADIPAPFVETVCRCCNMGLVRRGRSLICDVDVNSPGYAHVKFFAQCGYAVGKYQKRDVDLTNNGQYQCRGGFIIPFYFGFLYGLFERLITLPEFKSVQLVDCDFEMERSNMANNSITAVDICHVHTDIPRQALRKRYGRNTRIFDQLVGFWLDSLPWRRDPARQEFLDVHTAVTEYWLGKFEDELGVNVVVKYENRGGYHLSDGDFFSACKRCTVTLSTGRGLGMRNAYPSRRVQGEHTNLFWEGMYASPQRLKKYEKCWPNMVFYKGEHGCLDRAIVCKCQPWKSEPYVCICKGEFRDRRLCELDEIVAKYPYMIIGINIKTKKTHDQTGDWYTFEVLAHSPSFYEQEQPEVIFINIPEWQGGLCHCAKWITPKHTYEHYEKYEHVGKFNELLHIMCQTKDYVCPICSEVVAYAARKNHFKAHKHLFTCKYCGLFFDNERDFDYHGKYHCKVPRYMARLELEEDIKGYQEKTDKDTIINVYADLESAIQDDGEHINILAGWCADNDHRVHIETSVEKMLNEMAKLPSKEIRVYFHNGEGYDFHFLITVFCNIPGNKVRGFEIVNDSSEKIRYFTVTYREKKMHFKDTFAFVSESLEKWVESSKKSGCSFPCFKRNLEPEKHEEILKKNPFPYNAIKSEADLKRPFTEMLSWMDQENAEELFCNKFDKEQLHQIKDWLSGIHIGFNWFTIGDYYKDYLKCDVCQLCDVFEFFRQAVLEEYQIDIHQYFGTPGLTWAIWQRDNKYKLDPIMDSKAFDIITSSIRGGQTGAMTRYYDVEEEKNTFVCDLDCNALYATAMLRFKFPCHSWCRCANRDELAKNPEVIYDVIKKIHAQGQSGFVEVDINVKDEERFYSYVPVASKRTVRGVYDYQAMAEYAALYDEHISSMYFTGLTQVVGLHEHYCCHTRLLEWYMEHDVIEIKAFHDMVYGVEEPVFHDYVQHNLEQRKVFASDPIKKMLYKLLNNALYGKTYEDVTRRSNFQLKKKDKLPDPSKIYRTVESFGDWVLYEEVNEVCHIEKPIYLGAAITEYSKLWMYRFFYDYIRPKFPNTEVMYTDTDALTIKFTDCGFDDLRGLADAINTDEQQVIDTSNFSVPMTEHRHCDHNNEPGLFKSETGEGRIVKMVALRAKTYIMVCDDGTIKMSVKGCPMKEKSKLTFEMFKDVLLGEKEPYTIEFSAIRSEKHHVYSRELQKIVLSADDRKRYICDDKIHTYPLFSHFHRDALGKVTLPSGIKFTQCP